MTGLIPGTREMRERFPALHQQVNGSPLLYMDNAATTQKPREVIDALSAFYERDNSNVHRGLHELSARATASFEGARARLAAFLGAPSVDGIVFTRGATESINLAANAWGSGNLREGDRILLTVMEHHSNIVPWQMLCERLGGDIAIETVPLAAGHRLDLDAAERLLRPPVRLFAFTHVSNSLGTINPAAELCALARSRGIVTLLDAAQSCGHMPLDMEAIGCDFLALSGHKMCGPTGIGVLAIRPERFAEMRPWQGGGEMIERVSFEKSAFKAPPHCFEAGTPAIAEAIALGAACDFLDAVGRQAIRAHDERLAGAALELFSRIDGIEILGPEEGRAGVVSFQIGDIHPHDIVEVANRHGLALRGGHHCAQPLMRLLGKPSTARASFYLYNTLEEIERAAEILESVRKFFN